MRNPKQTKERIIQASAALFNQRGYSATSLRDITMASQLTKGAIYKHFENKAALEQAACQKMIEQMMSAMRLRIKSQHNVFDKLDIIFDFYLGHLKNPVIEGGCPILNAAVEADDSSNHLKPIVQAGLQVLQNSISHILNQGINHKQLKTNTPVSDLAVIICTNLEGAIMMSRINDDPHVMHVAISFLRQNLQAYKID